MNNDEIDKAIAEFCGWVFDPEWARDWGSRGRWCESPTGDRKFVHSIPKFHADMQFMWQAEQRLFTRYHYARDIFIDRLCRIMDPVNGYRKQSAIDIIDATAEQHALAFVETIKQIKP